MVFCPACGHNLPSGVTVCPECSKRLAPAAKKPAAPHLLLVIFVQVPCGFLVHNFSFIFVCAVCTMLGGGYKAHNGLLVLLAVVHCIAWIAYSIRLIRNPEERGFGFGIFIGVCLAVLLTGSCALSK